MRQSVRQRTFLSSREANQAGGTFGDFFGQNMAFPFARAQFHARDQAAKILVARARFDQQRIAPAVRGRHFGADMRSNGYFLGGQMKARRAVHAVAVEQSHGWHSVFRA